MGAAHFEQTQPPEAATTHAHDRGAGMPDMSRDRVDARPNSSSSDNVLPSLSIDGLDGVKGQKVLSETKYSNGQKDYELGNGNHVIEFAPGDQENRVAEVTSQGGHVHQTKYRDGHVEKTDDRQDDQPSKDGGEAGRGTDNHRDDSRHGDQPNESGSQGTSGEGGESNEEEEISNPDGSKIRSGPDGVRKEFPDGKAEITSPDGTVTTKYPEETRNKDGSVSKTYPYDGRKETTGYGADDPRDSQTEYPNGRKEVHYKNGNSEIQFEPNNKEGKVSEVTVDGGKTTITKFKDGHVEKEDENGDITKSYPPKNGKPGYNVVISKDAQGNTTVTREPYEEIATDPKRYEENAS
ncbi:MAG TPA: hypothetical protein PKZ32_00780 [Candidatus Melainabacteria bacterium]|nr:hypothetical protein [Candidatus Melainabacteria bacterium]